MANWSEAQNTELVQLWTDGVPPSQIAKQIGRTRNAVIGRVHRINLPPRRIKRDPANPQKVAVRARKPIKRFIERPQPVKSVAPPLEAPPGGIALLDLRRSHCRAIIDIDGFTSNPARYCGARVAYGSYCPHHSALFYQPPRPR